MDNQINLKQTTCPNCGAQLSFDPATLMISCRFCGSTFEINKAEDTITSSPDSIVPFSVSKKDINAIAMRWLSEGTFTPTDILDSVYISSLEGCYYPMFLYKGRYKGNWSATAGQDSVTTYNEWDPSRKKIMQQVRTSTTWTTNNGYLDSDYTVMSYAGSNNDVPPEVQGYLSQTDYYEKSPEKFDGKYVLGFKALDFNQDIRTVWENNGKQLANSAARAEVMSRMNGNRYKDLKMDVSLRPKEQSKIYIPFWVARFKYKNESHWLCIDGSNNHKVYGTRPIDPEKNQIKANFTYPYISLIVFSVSFLASSSFDQGSPMYSACSFILAASLIATIILFRRARKEAGLASSRAAIKRNEILSQKLQSGAILQGLQ